jgi:putative peptidoglycan lipid II flippase
MNHYFGRFCVELKPSHPALASGSVHALLKKALKGVGFLTLGMIVVRLAGLMRGIVVAQRFGLGDDLAAYLLGLVLVSLSNSLLGDALRECFIARYWADDGKTSARERGADFWPSVFQGSLLAILLMALLWNCYPWILKFLGRNMDSSTVELAIRLARACVGIILFQLWCGFLDALLQANHRYASSSVSPALIPFLTILSLLLLPGLGIWALVLGFYLGLVLRVSLLAIAARSLIPNFRGTHLFRGIGLWKLWKFQAAAAAIASLNLAVDRLMGAGLGAQSLAALDFGMTLSHIIERFCMVSLMTALLPGMSDSWGRGEEETVREGVRHTSQAFALFLAPFSVAVALSAPEIISVLYQRGGFTAEDTLRTAPILALYAAGWVTLAWTYLAGRGCLIAEKMRVLWPVALYELVLNFLLNLLFIQWLGAPGIALATSSLYIGSAVWLSIYLKKHTGMRALGPGLTVLIRLIPALLGQVFIMLILQKFWPWTPEGTGWFVRFARPVLIGGCGLAVYLLFAWFAVRSEMLFWVNALFHKPRPTNAG